MASAICRSMLANFLSRVLNILLSPSGSGNMLSQTDGALLTKKAPEDFGYLWLLVFTIHLAFSTMTRYYLGNVAGRLLILEISHADAAQKEEECHRNKRTPIFRNGRQAIPLIYRAQTWRNSSNALMLSILYNIIHLLVRTCIQTFIFTHSALQPLAYAISSVLLCDMHFLKTGAAIAASFPLSSLMTTDDPNRLQYLAGPAFALGMAKALTNAAEKIVQHLLISPPEQSETETNTRVGMHILVVILAITFCVVAMIPGTIVLTVTEASLLPPGLETLIPSATKGRGMLVSELLGGCEIPSGFAGWVTIMKPYRVAQIIWLIGLHLQKCHLHVLVELVTSFILLAVIAG